MDEAVGGRDLSLDGNRALRLCRHNLYSFAESKSIFGRCTCTGISTPMDSFLKERLKIGPEIGRGSFAQVFVGQYLDDTVAVKLFRDNWFGQSIDNLILDDEIEREANIIERKRSRHIVRLLYYSREEKWIMTEYCPNGSLHDVMIDASKKEIVEDWNYRLQWMYQVALGMHMVHNEPPTILHRDLKPSNIFLDEHFDAKIGDFGMATFVPYEQNIPMMCPGHHLQITWQPLEVITEQKYSTKSDVYSFGVIMHELLMLQGPYSFTYSMPNMDAAVCFHMKNGGGLEVPEDRSSIPGTWNPCLEQYIQLMYQCVASNPEDRPSFEEIARRLNDIRKNYKVNRQPEQGCVASNPPTRISTFKILVFVAFAVDTIALVLFLMRYCSLSNRTGSTQSLSNSNHLMLVLMFVCMVMIAVILVICLLLLCAQSLSTIMKDLVTGIQKLFSCGWFHQDKIKGATALSQSPFANGPVNTNDYLTASETRLVPTLSHSNYCQPWPTVEMRTKSNNQGDRALPMLSDGETNNAEILEGDRICIRTSTEANANHTLCDQGCARAMPELHQEGEMERDLELGL